MEYALVSVMRKGGYPIILQVKIPDKNLIIPDFDADPNRTTPYYKSYPKYSGFHITMKPHGMSMHTGKFGYVGPILPQHIEWIYFMVGDGNKLRKVSPSVLKRFLENWDITDFVRRIDAYTPHERGFR